MTVSKSKSNRRPQMLERQMADNVERLRKSKETARDSIERSRQLVAASKKAIEAATSLRRHTKAVTRKPVKSDPRVFQRTSIQKPISVK